MTNKGVQFPAPNGSTVVIQAVDTGTVDDFGHSIFLLGTSDGVQVVGPTVATTTNSFADVKPPMDTLFSHSVSLTVINTGGINSVDYQVIGANNSDFSDAVTVKVSATLAPGAVGSFSDGNAPYRYYKVQVKATAAGNQTTVKVTGVAK